MDYKKIIGQALLLLVLLVAVYFAYQVFQGGEEAGDSKAEVGPTAAGGKTLSLLQDVEQIEFSGAVFSSPTFFSLEGIAQGEGGQSNSGEELVDIDPQPTGRSNPFAPIGQGGVVSNSDDDGDAPESTEASSS